MYGDFFDYIRYILLIGKYSGLVPVVGYNSKKSFRFSWLSIWTFLYVICLSILMYMIAVLAYGYYITGFSVIIFSQLLFFVIYWLNSLMLFRFSRKIGSFLKDVSDLEKFLPATRKPRSTIRSIHRLMFVFVYFVITEQIYYNMYLMYMTHQCHKRPEDSGLYMKSYFLLTFKWYFEFLPFSYVVSVILQVIRTQACIMWIYGNLIIAVISIYLKNRFNEFNRLIVDDNGIFKKDFKPSWAELQVHYSRLSKLVSIFNDHFGPTVLITYTCNIMYVCTQTFFIVNGLRRKPIIEFGDCDANHSYDLLPSLIIAHNLFCLVIRAAFICYVASEVHIASRKCLKAMHSVPSMDWNTDMKRLMTQIHYSKLGVSGLQFFLVSRGMILGMVAKTITYELVLAQF